MNKQDILDIVQKAMDDNLYSTVYGDGTSFVYGQEDVYYQVEQELDKLFNDNDLSKF